MGKYDTTGGYAGYNKNNEEREPYDYYATPPEEVTNAIKTIKPWNLNNTKDLVILEPCCGGGHMSLGICDSGFEGTLINTDVVYHPSDIYKKALENGLNIGSHFKFGKEYDFCSKNYKLEKGKINYIVMNPPFSLTIPFVNHALDIAEDGVLMFNRLQFIESQKRFEYIFKDNPPTVIYQYVDRVSCIKAGDYSKKVGSVQAYSWFYWDKHNTSKETKLYWIRKVGKGEK